MPGQCVDDPWINHRAFGRNQDRPLLTAKVVVDDRPMVVIGDDQIIARPLIFAGEQQMRVRYNDLVAAAGSGNTLADMKVEIRISNRLMEISREIHWRSPKDAITRADDFVMTSCRAGSPGEALRRKAGVANGPLARPQSWMRSTQTRNIGPPKK
jgi:hypothetical protein